MRLDSFYLASYFLGFSFILAFFLTPLVSGQKKGNCRIGDTAFACPKGFVKLPDVDPQTRLFRLEEDETTLYVFVSVRVGDFVDSLLKKSLDGYYRSKSNGEFQWKVVKNPLYMSINTKYESKFDASFGFWDRYLLELKYFTFAVGGKNIVIGYVANWGEQPWLNKRLFERGEGLGDSAVGCNEVATLLNSITKEFKQKNQNCTITGSALE